ncbi:ABC transporter ATP-binding protein [Paenibacillus sp. KN14-4R]|uniref:ABC transporter ATP-binding protein n=1 Tax=Paenibacillus sp. KN14-4R TaxID=3445773 RepID=UPI003FA141E3
MQIINLYKQIKGYLVKRGFLTAIAYGLSFLRLALIMIQPLIFGYLIDNVLVEKKKELIIPILLFALLIAIITMVFLVIQVSLFRYLGISQTLEIREHLIRHLRKIPLSEIEKNGSGKFVPLLGNDTAAMANFLNNIMVEISNHVFSIFIALGIIFYLDWRLGLIAVIMIPFLLILPKMFKHPLGVHYSDVRSHNEEIGTFLVECVEGSREIKALQLEEWEIKRNKGMYRNLVKSSVKSTMYSVLSGQVSTLPISLIIVFTYWFGSQQVLSDSMSIGMMVATVTYLEGILHPIQSINRFFGDIQLTEVSLKRIKEFLSISKDKQQSIEYIQDTKISAGKKLVLQSESITLESDDHYKILDQISVKAQQGSVIAFVGRSGSGKTSLFKVLAGLGSANSGKVKIYGKFETEGNDKVNSQFGVVFQEQFVFKGTLSENISLGKLTATSDEIYEAACKADLKEFIDSLPKGLDTVVNYRGFQLSGGQKQRIALARMFLRNPDILILDEPTSALDSITEARVMEQLLSHDSKRTRLISTHKIDTIINADYIYVLEDGRIIEEGTHDSLMKLNGIYCEMVLNKMSLV